MFHEYNGVPECFEDLSAEENENSGFPTEDSAHHWRRHEGEKAVSCTKEIMIHPPPVCKE